jgi:hypothetical protein
MDLNHIVRPHGQSPLPRLVTPSLYLDAHARLRDDGWFIRGSFFCAFLRLLVLPWRLCVKF